MAAYNGNVSGNRHSRLDQSIGRMCRADQSLLFSLAQRQQAGSDRRWCGRCHVRDDREPGVRFDAATGLEIWRTAGADEEPVGDAAGGINRGVALLGDRLFMITDHAHLIALHRVTGGLIWM